MHAGISVYVRAHKAGGAKTWRVYRSRASEEVINIREVCRHPMKCMLLVSHWPSTIVADAYRTQQSVRGAERLLLDNMCQQT